MGREINQRKAAIIGCGFVGSATAFTLMQSQLFSELVLVDVDFDKADGEAKDIAHGIPFAGQMKIHAGTYEDLSDAAIIIVTAGVPLAVDVIAGERERNTFEALLSTKADRLSILVGKYLSILVFSLIAIIMSFAGLILGMVMNPEMFTNGEQTISVSIILQSMNMPIGAMLLTLLSAITLTVAFSGIQMVISTISKSVKEAQTYLSYLSMPAMILGFATMFMGAGDMQDYMAYIPIFNTIASLKMALSGVVNYSFLITGVIINMIFVIIISIFITKLFNKEKIIMK